MAQRAWTRWLGPRGVRGGVDLVALVMVGEAHWIGSMDIMGWGWGWVAIVRKGLRIWWRSIASGDWTFYNIYLIILILILLHFIFLDVFFRT